MNLAIWTRIMREPKVQILGVNTTDHKYVWNTTRILVLEVKERKANGLISSPISGVTFLSHLYPGHTGYPTQDWLTRHYTVDYPESCSIHLTQGPQSKITITRTESD